MPIIIPLRGDLSFFDLQQTLDDVTYTLEFRWNERANNYFWSILDETGEIPYAEGMPVLVAWPANAYAAERKPPGALVFFDTAGGVNDLVRQDELGVRIQLWYFTEAELAGTA